MASLDGTIADIYQHLHSVFSSSSFQTTTSAVGTFTLLYTTSKFFAFLYRNTFPTGNLKKYQASGPARSWALVTGGSDGIGHGFVEELLQRDFNVFIHGRNPEKLAKRKAAFEATYGIDRVEIIVADAGNLDSTDATAHVLSHIRSTLSKTDGKLTLLVNNVGGVQTKPQYLPLASMPPGDLHNQVATNILFPLHLTKTLLPFLSSQSPSRGHGGGGGGGGGPVPACILNISSSTATLAPPYIATYCGTKGFVSSWSRALAVEMAAEGAAAAIEVKCAIVCNTTSALNERELGGITISAGECARGCLAQVGRNPGRTFIYPHWKHALCVAWLERMPEWFVRWILIGEMKARRREEMEKGS